MPTEFVALDIVLMADIEGEGHPAGDDVACTWLGGNLTDGRYGAFAFAGGPLDGEDELCGGSEGIAAKVHRHGARVPGLAGEGDRDPTLAGNGRDHPDGKLEVFKDRPLLQMALNISRERIRHGIRKEES